MELFGVASVASIAVIAELFAVAWKISPLDNRWVPAVCPTVGGILGVLGWLFWPTVYPATDPFTAAAVGIASGSAAVNAYEIITTQIEAKRLADESKKAQ